jgi:ferredoxin-nitrite reductase
MRVPADEVPGAIKNLIANFEDERTDGETFRDFVERHDEDELAAFIEPEETSYDDPYMHNTKQTWYPYAEGDDSMDASPAPTDGEGKPLNPADD